MGKKNHPNGTHSILKVCAQETNNEALGYTILSEQKLNSHSFVLRRKLSANILTRSGVCASIEVCL